MRQAPCLRLQWSVSGRVQGRLQKTPDWQQIGQFCRSRGCSIFCRCGGNAICTAETAVAENARIGSVRNFER